MDATILLPASFVMVGTDRIFLTVADGIELIAGDAGVHEIVPGGLGAGIAESDIVFGRTALVAIAFDLQFVAGILREDRRQFFGIGGQGADRVAAQGVRVVVEVGVLDAADQFIDASPRGGIGVVG